MAVKYKVVSKRPGGIAGDNEPLYYPALTERSTIDSRELALRISKRTSMSMADVMGMIEILIELVPEYLQQGHNVRLDDFGTFSIHVSGVGREDPDKVTHRDITAVKMAFLPSKLVKKRLAATEFRKHV